ncbi:hypothetical protein SAMN04487948_12557 [Halogranum amylolyticum]|uniref:Uncharacterized protein n=1 Tax=Halogranum amylolyticum TaxID=660520 RepID=A0A1H8W8V8_9EURY|nr:hypothetical protein [Halogranum amylolyticum]SEP24092.1 hypothetical protein SAMN04487948_12557 [Halogranum amylolyticum]
MVRPVTVTLVGDRLSVAAAFQQLDEMMSEVTTERWTEVPRGPTAGTQSPERARVATDTDLDVAVERASARAATGSVPVDVLRLSVAVPSEIARDIVATVLHNHLTDRTRPVQVVIENDRVTEHDELDELQRRVCDAANGEAVVE